MKKPLYLLLVVILVVQCTVFESKRNIVGIQPYNNFEPRLAQKIKSTIEDIYGMETIILPEKKIPKEFFVNIKSPRYRADSLIKHQSKTISNDVDFILGLTPTDISTTKTAKAGTLTKTGNNYQDWGIFGLGYRPGNSCVVSTFRIKHSDPEIFEARLQKISLHELGHNFGLPHCSDKKCLMTDAVEKISTVDNANLDLCSKCKTFLKRRNIL